MLLYNYKNIILIGDMMQKENYVNYIKYTLTTYNKSNKKLLLKIYEREGIAKKKDSQKTLFEEELVQIDYSNIDESIFACIDRSDKAIEEYEKFQVTRNYKYSVICTTDNFKDVIQKISNISQYQYNIEKINIYDEIKDPIRFEYEDHIILLFNKKYEAIHPQTGDELFLHYPVLVVFHKNINLVEIRFDTVKRLFTGGDRDQNIYNRLIDEILKYLEDNYHIKIVPMDLDFMVELTKKDENKDIKLISQYMNLATGGKAQLAVGNNEEYVLPIIGELKNIINDLKDELNNNLKIKDALEQFIFEKEETTDYPWIEVLFLNKEGIKTRNNHVKFTFNYMGKSYSLITYYYNDALIGMERMNDVTRFIGENFN